MPLIIIRHRKQRAGLILQETVTLGRLDDCEVTLKSRGVSRAHARISLVDGRHVIEDLGSTNGTYVNDIRLHDPQPLQEGDEIRIGKIIITYLEQSKLPAGLPQLRHKKPRSVIFRCNVCSVVLQADRNKVGKKGKCKGCGTRILVPDPNTVPDFLQVS